MTTTLHQYQHTLTHTAKQPQSRTNKHNQEYVCMCVYTTKAKEMVDEKSMHSTAAVGAVLHAYIIIPFSVL